jgi:hypothetical protein
MSLNIIARAFLSLGLMSSTFLAAACSDAPASEESASESGTLSVPLLASAGEHTYRLDGSMYVSGPVFEWIDLYTDAEVASAQLPTGGYYASLQYWSLSRDDGFGNFLPVNAELVSSSSPWFSIFNQTTSTISFQFETDGQVVTVGAGSLNVVVAVNETPAACTPLGSDCAEGTWCAPSELTGSPLDCIAVGPAAAGDACSSPLDCAANTSCFDFGAGAVCTSLCSAAEFDQPCADGGTCTAQGLDYGVCAPSSP